MHTSQPVLELLQRDRKNPVFRSVVIAKFEVLVGELGIPPDAVEQFVNRSHSEGGSPARFLLSMPIVGSKTHVLRHSGHLEGLVNFSAENSKPHARPRAGSTAALFSECLKLRKR